MSTGNGLINTIYQFSDWLATAKESRQATIDAYHSDITQLADYLDQQGLAFANVTPDVIREFLASLAAAKSSTKVRKYAAMRTFFAWARQVGVVTVDPTADDSARPARGERHEVRVLAAEQIARIVMVAPECSRERAIMALLAAGLTVSEVCRLTVRDLRLDDGVVMVKARPTADLDRNPTGAERPVHLDEVVVKALEGYLVQTWPSSKRHPSVTALFLNYAGRGISRQCVWQVLREAGKAAGIPDVTPSMMRASFAVQLLRAGADVDVVRGQMGHADVSTTQRYAEIARRLRLKEAAHAG